MSVGKLDQVSSWNYCCASMTYQGRESPKQREQHPLSYHIEAMGRG